LRIVLREHLVENWRDVHCVDSAVWTCSYEMTMLPAGMPCKSFAFRPMTHYALHLPTISGSTPLLYHDCLHCTSNIICKRLKTIWLYTFTPSYSRSYLSFRQQQDVT
jgi:hypothetical protein